jgi:hypothetical protein
MVSKVKPCGPKSLNFLIKLRNGYSVQFKVLPASLMFAPQEMHIVTYILFLLIGHHHFSPASTVLFTQSDTWGGGDHFHFMAARGLRLIQNDMWGGDHFYFRGFFCAECAFVGCAQRWPSTSPPGTCDTAISLASVLGDKRVKVVCPE